MTSLPQRGGMPTVTCTHTSAMSQHPKATDPNHDPNPWMPLFFLAIWRHSANLGEPYAPFLSSPNHIVTLILPSL